MAKILVVEDDADARNLVRVKLTKAGHDVTLAEDGESALAAALNERPDLVVLDVMLPRMDGYEVARRLRQNPAMSQVAILMLTARSDIADKVAGFESGVDDYLTKPFDPAELELRVRILLMRIGARPAEKGELKPGLVISFFSLRGGVGRTSLAVNTAVSLGQLWSMPVPLVDLSLLNAHCTLMLGLQPRGSIQDLIESWNTFTKVEDFADYLASHESQVHVLPGPREPAAAENVSGEMVKRLLRLFIESFPHVVVDLPATFNDVSLAALDASDLIVIVLAPELASVQTTLKTLDTFTDLGYAHDRFVLVLNQVIGRRALPPSQIESALGVKLEAVIPYDEDGFVTALNAGKPYVISAPNGPATRPIQDFAYRHSVLDRVQLPNTAPTALAKLVMGRVKRK